MEKVQESCKKALEHLKLADHMLHVTYPLLKDTKLLLGIIDNIFLALTGSMSAVLYHDRMFKRIPPFHNKYQSKFNMFKLKCVPDHKIKEDILTMIQDIKEIIMLHRESPVEFRRKDSFVICNEAFNTTTVTVSQIKSYFKRTKKFVEKTQKIIRTK